MLKKNLTNIGVFTNVGWFPFFEKLDFVNKDKVYVYL
jgi:hypothetical protein